MGMYKTNAGQENTNSFKQGAESNCEQISGVNLIAKLKPVKPGDHQLTGFQGTSNQ